MRTFTVPAAYARYVESELNILLDRIGADRGWREDADHPDLQQFCRREITERIDPELKGVATIVVGIEDGVVAPVPKRGDRLARVLKVAV